MTRILIPAAILGAGLALAACTKEAPHGWLGYAEGETALIAPPQAGWITSVAVTRGQMVKDGDILFALDSPREIAARDDATAAIAVAEAQGAQAIAQARQADATISQTQKELERQRGLVRLGASPQRDLEQAQAAYDTARAARGQANAQKGQADAQAKQATASLATADVNLAERVVRARVAGQVQDIFFREGEYANAGTPVISVLPPANVFVRFFIPEEELSQVKLGERVHIGCDGCPPDLTATISFVASEVEYTPPIIYSVTNRKKLMFKAEARAQGGLALRPGLPVDVSLATAPARP